MKWLLFRACPLMDKAGEEGGSGAGAEGGGAGAEGGGAGAGTEGGAEPAPRQEAPESAVAAIVKEFGKDGAEAAKKTVEAGGKGAGEEDADIDLANTSDDDYARIVVPDMEGEEADRSLITPMAKELREAGIQPRVMAKIAAIYKKAVAAELEKDAADRAKRMKEMSAKCLNEVSEEEKKNFAAAYGEYIAADPRLKRIIDETELGVDSGFIKLIAIAGAALRVETPPPASATAGSSLHDTDRRVYEATVPKHLR